MMNSKATTDTRHNAIEESALRTASEQTVAAIWAEILQLPSPPGATEDFFELGGNSMLMVMAEFRILEEIGVQLPAGALLAGPTVREIAALTEQMRGDLNTCLGSASSVE